MPRSLESLRLYISEIDLLLGREYIGSRRGSNGGRNGALLLCPRHSCKKQEDTERPRNGQGTYSIHNLV